MAVYKNTVYIKPGAVFSNAEEAQADKNQFFTPELSRSVEDCYRQMLTDGVLLEPVTYYWDQEIFSLITVRYVTNQADYLNAITFDIQQVIDFSTQAGWQHINNPRHDL